MTGGYKKPGRDTTHRHVPWSVKGVLPEAREAAKLAARKAGAPLGAWLSQTILSTAAVQLKRDAPPASQAGGNTCGTWCENYCHATQTFCTGGNSLYNDLASCHTACQGFATDGLDGDTTGNTVQCRITQAWQGSISPEQGCPAAAPDGGGTCVNPNSSPNPDPSTKP